MPDHHSSWILFTSQAIRWHLMVEGMPGQAVLLNPFPDVPRVIKYELVSDVQVSRSSASPLRGQADSTMFLIVHEHDGSQFVQVLSVGTASSREVLDLLHLYVGRTAFR